MHGKLGAQAARRPTSSASAPALSLACLTSPSACDSAAEPVRHPRTVHACARRYAPARVPPNRSCAPQLPCASDVLCFPLCYHAPPHPLPVPTCPQPERTQLPSLAPSSPWRPLCPVLRDELATVATVVYHGTPIYCVMHASNGCARSRAIHLSKFAMSRPCLYLLTSLPPAEPAHCVCTHMPPNRVHCARPFFPFPPIPLASCASRSTASPARRGESGIGMGAKAGAGAGAGAAGATGAGGASILSSIPEKPALHYPGKSAPCAAQQK